MMHHVHLFGGGRLLVWKTKMLVLAFFIAVAGLVYLGRRVWITRRRPKVEEW